MNNVSWGTREVTERKSPEQMAAEKLEAEEAAKKKAMKKSFLGELYKIWSISLFFSFDCKIFHFLQAQYLGETVME